MNILLYYGGFGLAITLFLLAAVFFFAFRIPKVARYLRSTSRKGLVKAAQVEDDAKKDAARKSAVFEEGDDSSTMPLDVLAGDTDTINMRTTTGLTGRMAPPVSKAESNGTQTGAATEILEQTSILTDEE